MIRNVETHPVGRYWGTGSKPQKGDKSGFTTTLEGVNDLQSVTLQAGEQTKSTVFPLQNASRTIKDAWEKAITGLSPKERAQAEIPLSLVENSPNHPKILEGKDDSISFVGGAWHFCSLVNQSIERLTSEIRTTTDPELKKLEEFQVGVLRNFLKNIQDNLQNKCFLS